MYGRKMDNDPNYQNNPDLVTNIENTVKQEIMRMHPQYLTDDNSEIEIIH